MSLPSSLIGSHVRKRSFVTIERAAIVRRSIVQRHIVERAVPIASHVAKLVAKHDDSFVAHRLHGGCMQRGHAQLSLVKLNGRVRMRIQILHHVMILFAMGKWRKVWRLMMHRGRMVRMRHAALHVKMLENGRIFRTTKRMV